jgi:hypothetical protein
MYLYINFVKAYPIYSAMLQFAIFGTIGDYIAKRLQKGRFSILDYIWKPIEWAILAIFIKYAFIGFTGFVSYLVKYSYLPSGCDIERSFFNAFSISVFMNMQFGLFLVIIHRFLDCLPKKKFYWTGINKGFYSLIWFWIPAHTITFMLPKDYQIALAALWSIALGFILSLFNKKIT